MLATSLLIPYVSERVFMNTEEKMGLLLLARHSTTRRSTTRRSTKEHHTLHRCAAASCTCSVRWLRACVALLAARAPLKNLWPPSLSSLPFLPAQKLILLSRLAPFPSDVNPKTPTAVMKALKKLHHDKKMGEINILSRIGGFFLHVARLLARPSQPQLASAVCPAPVTHRGAPR